MTPNTEPDAGWVHAVRALARNGISDPALLVYLLMKGVIVLPTGRFEMGGGYPRALATVASALGTDAEAVQDAYIARAARGSDAAKLIAEARAVLPAVGKALPSAQVAMELPHYGSHPGDLVGFVQHIVKAGAASLPPPRSSPEWRRLIGALAARAHSDAETLIVLARFRRVHFDSGEVAEPLEEEDAYLTVAEALARKPDEVRVAAERRFKAASLVRGPNFARMAMGLEPAVAECPGVTRVERVTTESAIVAKRTIEGATPRPPWAHFPDDPPSSMRWRMGAGEDVLDRWHPYWETLDTEDRAAYLAEHQPPPIWREWLGTPDDEADGEPQSPRRAIHFYRVNEPFGFLSNFAKAPIMLDDRRWPTSEHYFQAQKFAGATEQEQVRAAPSAGEAARLGRTLPGIRPDWAHARDAVMLRALRAKFNQHPYLRSQLLETGNAYLVERTMNDGHWADGGDGSGRNRLGELLMQVREELRSGGPT